MQLFCLGVLEHGFPYTIFHFNCESCAICTLVKFWKTLRLIDQNRSWAATVSLRSDSASTSSSSRFEYVLLISSKSRDCLNVDCNGPPRWIAGPAIMLKSTDSPYAKTLFTAVIKKAIYMKNIICISMKYSNLLKFLTY